MNEGKLDISDFSKILRVTLKNLDSIYPSDDTESTFPNINSADLDIGQKEIWRRIQQIDMFCGHGCEACEDGFFDEVKASKQLIRDYLSGKFTHPQEPGFIFYMKDDRSESYSITLSIEDNRPKVISVESKLSREVQDRLKNQLVDEIKDVKVPLFVAGYSTDGKFQKFVLFQEELPIAQKPSSSVDE